MAHLRRDSLLKVCVHCGLRGGSNWRRPRTSQQHSLHSPQAENAAHRRVQAASRTLQPRVFPCVECEENEARWPRPFNYTQETFTKSLWIAEGVTSYYDDLILRRAGIVSVGEYFDLFSTNANLMLSLPGWKWESAEEASFDAWIKFYRPDENTPNVSSSYYVQGAVIGWMIDMEIRRNSNGQRTFDGVMKKVYRDTYKRENRGYTDEEFERVCNEVAGTSLSEEIFERRVRGRERVDFDKYLSYAGLKLGPKNKQESKKEDERRPGFLGVKLKTDSGKTLISSRLFDTPAEASGLEVGD